MKTYLLIENIVEGYFNYVISYSKNSTALKFKHRCDSINDRPSTYEFVNKTELWSKYWNFKEKFHRITGPARIFDGISCYFLNGQIINKKEWEKEIVNYDKNNKT